MGGILGRRAWKTCQLPIGYGEETEHGAASEQNNRADKSSPNAAGAVIVTVKIMRGFVGQGRSCRGRLGQVGGVGQNRKEAEHAVATQRESPTSRGSHMNELYL